MDHNEIEGAVTKILTSVGEDPQREGLLNTPGRVARMYAELLEGYTIDPAALVNNALFHAEYDEMFGRRLQIQERMTRQIADFLMATVEPQGVGVVIEALHMCSMIRGVEKAEARMVTSAMVGVFKRDPRTRGEFMQHIYRPPTKEF